MTDLKDMTATELARCLDDMADFPHNTGGLSQLDEATLAFGDLSGEVEQAHTEFATARHAHMRSWDGGGYSNEAWTTAMHATQRLAGALRTLGHARINRCQKMAGLDVQPAARR